VTSASPEKTKILSTAEVHAAVSGLLTIDHWRGVRRTLFNIVVANSLLILTLSTESVWLFLPLALVTGFFYTSIMITTHDAMHHTLSGWYWFDEIVPRFYSYFIFWPHGLYSELHKLHHKYNGRDLHDPENPTVTVEDYKQASTFKKFRMRHKLWLSLLVYGGIGLIVQHFREGFHRWDSHRPVRRLIITDIAGIMVATAITFAVLSYTGITWKYAVYLFFVERLLGFAMQLRLHIEHYGLWGERASIVETRLYNCRNIATNTVGEWFYNGLNYHSVHHAFPAIPFYHLKTAHDRLNDLCRTGGEELPAGNGYFRTILNLARQPVLIADDNRMQSPAVYDKVS
jgi:fatty acid desaturase